MEEDRQERLSNATRALQQHAHKCLFIKDSTRLAEQITVKNDE